MPARTKQYIACAPKKRVMATEVFGVDIVKLLAFILPAYVANSSPVVFGGGTRIDFGKSLHDGKRLFGDGKTYRGLLAGVVFGTFTGFVVALADVGGIPLSFRSKMVAAFLLSVGTLVGDAAGSFIKRRMGISHGSQHEFFDQLLFLGGALLFASIVFLPTLQEIVVLVVMTYVLHKAANWLAHKAQIKNVPW